MARIVASFVVHKLGRQVLVHDVASATAAVEALVAVVLARLTAGEVLVVLVAVAGSLGRSPGNGRVVGWVCLALSHLLFVLQIASEPIERYSINRFDLFTIFSHLLEHLLVRREIEQIFRFRFQIVAFVVNAFGVCWLSQPFLLCDTLRFPFDTHPMFRPWSLLVSHAGAGVSAEAVLLAVILFCLLHVP